MSNGPKKTRTEQVSVRMTPDLLRASALVAAATGRTTSGFIEYATKRYIEHNFPNALSPAAKIVLTIHLPDGPEDSA